MSVGTDGMPPNSVQVVAAQLQADMRQRGLRPGDRYLTAAEVAHTFSISSMAAHRAMRALADRDILVRQRSRGTFIGPSFRVSTDCRENLLDVVHLVMGMEYHITHDISSDRIVDELSKAIPGICVQVHHVTEQAARRHAMALVERIGDSHREGIILVRCAQEVQSLVAKSSIPAIVYGQTYSDVELSSVGHDQVAVGRLMSQCALDKGGRRFALLTHKGWRRGDHIMVDTIMQSLGAASIGLDAVKVRSLVPDRDVVARTVREMLEGAEPADTFLCRDDFYARVASEVVALSASRSICIVSGCHGTGESCQDFDRVVSTVGLHEQVELLAEMLVATATSGDGKRRVVTLPVSLSESGQRAKSPSG